MQPYEKQLKRATVDVFNDIQKEAIKNITNDFGKKQTSYFNVSRAITNLKKRVLPILTLIAGSSTESGLKILSETYLAETWFERNARISKEYSIRISDSINTLDKNLKDDVRRSLARHTSLDPSEQLKKLLEDTNDKFNDYYKQGRAETIARTNTSAVDNAVKRDTWSEMGVRELEWITEGDNDVRDSHRAMEGTRIKIDGEFNVNGEPMPHPAGGEKPSESVNCRCTLLPIV